MDYTAVDQSRILPLHSPPLVEELDGEKSVGDCPVPQACDRGSDAQR